VLPCPETGLHVFCPKTREEVTGKKKKKGKKHQGIKVLFKEKKNKFK